MKSLRYYILLVESGSSDLANDPVERFNRDALPVFHDRLVQPGRPLHRIGNDYEYSELTHDPSGTGRSPRMSGGRGSGFASGMYAYQTQGQHTRRVRGPVHPLIIYQHGDASSGHRAPAAFQRDAISMMRMAECLANGKVDLNKPTPFEELLSRTETPFERAQHVQLYGGKSFSRVMMDLADYRPAGVSWTQARNDILQACIDWARHRHVHPLNILLSRWGYDGIMWGGNAEKDGNTGDFGAVVFPPISHDGELVGTQPRDSKFVELHPELRSGD